jgi:hypothetical protein
MPEQLSSETSGEGFAFACWVRLRFPLYCSYNTINADGLLHDMWREDAR